MASIFNWALSFFTSTLPAVNPPEIQTQRIPDLDTLTQQRTAKAAEEALKYPYVPSTESMSHKAEHRTEFDKFLARRLQDEFDKEVLKDEPPAKKRSGSPLEENSDPDKLSPDSKRSRPAHINPYPGIKNPSTYCPLITAIHLFEEIPSISSADRRKIWNDDAKCLFDFIQLHKQSHEQNCVLAEDVKHLVEGADALEDTSVILTQINNLAFGDRRYFDYISIPVRGALEITSLSNNVIFQVNRFQYNERTKRVIKDSKVKDMPLQSGDFQLKCIIAHKKSASGKSGKISHYTAYKIMDDGKWYLFDDGFVKEVTLSEINKVRKTGYIYLYSK
ncbi:MAG: ubiquitin carboxyl-terminal hydrolase [Parachlamydiales bacterium]|nr:ubiquitin carboxyl-terminal hydrolase [Parachlamydiales bacterium]